MDTWEPARALELVEHESIAVMISHAGVHADDDRPSRVRRHRPRRRSGCSRSAARAWRPRWCAKARRAFDCWCKRTYGSTEYPTLTTGRLGDDPERDATTDGPLIGAAELRIVDPKTLVDVAHGAPGELLARGPEMFVGYLDPDARRRRRSSHGGWFRTGDLAVYDGELPHHRRPAEGHHHPGRREHLRAGGRSAARDAPGDRRGRVRRHARPGHGREGLRVRDRRGQDPHRRSRRCGRTWSRTARAVQAARTPRGARRRSRAPRAARCRRRRCAPSWASRPPWMTFRD